MDETRKADNMHDSIFTIKIDYDDVISIEEFSKSLDGWNNQFKKFSGDEVLLIKDIRQGSIIIDAVASVVPMLRDINTVCSFFEHVKALFGWFAHKIGNKPEKIKRVDLEDYKNIISPVYHSNGKQINISVNGNNNNVLIVDRAMAQSIVKNIDDEITKLQETTENSNYHGNVILKFIQIKNDEIDKKNTKGIIEKY